MTDTLLEVEPDGLVSVAVPLPRVRVSRFDQQSVVSTVDYRSGFSCPLGKESLGGEREKTSQDQETETERPPSVRHHHRLSHG